MEYASFVSGSMNGPGYFRGGRGGRPHRSYRPNQPFHDRRPPRSFTQSSAAPTVAETPEMKVAQSILHLGDRAAQPLEQIMQTVATSLQTEFGQHKELLLSALGNGVSQIPGKTHLFGTLIGIVNAASFDIGREIVTYLHKLLQDELSHGHFTKVKLLVRCFAELVNANVILPDFVVNLMSDFLRVAKESNIPATRSDTFVQIAMITLPFFGKTLQERRPNELNQFLQEMSLYMAHRNKTYLKALQHHAKDAHVLHEIDSMDALWQEILQLQKSHWHVDPVFRMYESFDAILGQAMQHTLPNITIPSHHVSMKYFIPRIQFTLFSSQELPRITVESSLISSMDRFLLQDMISDVFQFFEMNHKDCTKQLFQLPLATTVAISYLIVECLFRDVLRLPLAEFKAVFYNTLFYDVGRVDSVYGPAAVKQAIHRFFDILHELDTESTMRLCEWFAIYLSDFDYSWPWNEWLSKIESAKLSPMSPQVVFIRETLKKCVRLSYFERISGTVPQGMMANLEIPAPSVSFRYAVLKEDAKLHSIVQNVLNAMKSKLGSEAIQNLLNLVEEEHLKEMQAMLNADNYHRAFAQADSVTGVHALRADIFLQCMLNTGSKSFSHVLNVVERYLPTLQTLAATPQGKLYAIRAIESFWTLNEQFVVILVDKFMAYRIIDSSTVVQWIFSPDMQLKFSNHYIWEILTNTLNKMMNRVLQIRMKLEKEEIDAREKEANRDNQKRQFQAEGQWTEDHEKAHQQERQLSEEKLKMYTTALNTASKEQKETFVLVFRKFIECMTPRLAENAEENALWLFWAEGRFKEMIRKYYKETRQFLVTLESLVFVPGTTHPRLLDIFDWVRVLNF